MVMNSNRSTSFLNKVKHSIKSIFNYNCQNAQLELAEQQRILFETQNASFKQQAEYLNEAIELIKTQNQEMLRLESQIKETEIKIENQLNQIEIRREQSFLENKLIKLIPRIRRNLLPNDSSALQKTLLTMWRNNKESILGYKDFLESGFRVFSQNDEDGVLLRIFSHIGNHNNLVVEIGSNCADSDIGIPENLSTNLVVNHGWHGLIFEIDQNECDRMRYFFARDLATKHFHMLQNGQHDYFSPIIVQNEICPENINKVLRDTTDEVEPDLLVIDIDGGDYAVIRNMREIKPRVLVVEFEKRFRDRYSVVQYDCANFSKKWPQSGAASLPAWEKLFESKGYSLCAIGTCGFNAFFVRSDICSGKIKSITSREAFDGHPILSKVTEEFWLRPDETWQEV